MSGFKLANSIKSAVSLYHIGDFLLIFIAHIYML